MFDVGLDDGGGDWIVCLYVGENSSISASAVSVYRTLMSGDDARILWPLVRRSQISPRAYPPSCGRLPRGPQGLAHTARHIPARAQAAIAAPPLAPPRAKCRRAR